MGCFPLAMCVEFWLISYPWMHTKGVLVKETLGVELPYHRWPEGQWVYTLHWRHNDHDGVSNHQPHGWLLNRLFWCRTKKTSKLRFTGLCAWKSPGPVNSPRKGPVTRKMLPFDDVIMNLPETYALPPSIGFIFASMPPPAAILHYI